MTNEINWLAYRADVAKLMLPHIYQRVLKDNQERPVSTMRDPADVAIDQTIDIATEMAERLERRLKKGGGQA